MPPDTAVTDPQRPPRRLADAAPLPALPVAARQSGAALADRRRGRCSILAAKAVQLILPFCYKCAVDAMTVTRRPGAEPSRWPSCSATRSGRFAGMLFDNLRNIVFERVGQDATRALAEDVFARLHRLSLRFHLARRTGEVTKVIERGTKSIDMMLYFMLFNIAPTVLELIAVGGDLLFQLRLGLVAATAVAVVAYIRVTRRITEWRTELREKMNRLDGQALSRAVDSLLNYETVKYFAAEKREEARYAQATRAYAEAAVKSENSLGLLNIAQALIVNLLMAGRWPGPCGAGRRGSYTVGDLVFVNTYLTQLFRPLDMLGMVYRTIRQGLIDMAEMFRLIDTDVEVQDAPGAPALVDPPADAGLRRTSCSAMTGTATILHGLSFEVPAGQQRGDGRPLGRGQVHDRAAAVPLLRSVGGPHPDRRAGHQARSRRRRCARRSASSRRIRCCSTRRSATTSATAATARRMAGRSRRRRAARR